ncbi:DUF899 domain-containing protein [Actinoplanes sp. G11-F43]|uniref:DUF899 domain-containing protein n=1 Tax=Actinoplanes sp. G11-F43 TaxID=3424130 RepID=UPI003D34BDA9
MSLPEVVSREVWLVARKRFLATEKQLTRARDEVNAERRRLPMTRVDDGYVFDTAAGPRSLLDLFEGRRQLIVYHAMPFRDADSFCKSCSFWIDNIGHPAHLNARDTSLVIDCPEPLDKIQKVVDRMGWGRLTWTSSAGTDFYRHLWVTPDGAREALPPGVSAFLRDGDAVFHTYSTHQRGSELLNGTYMYLDLTALGRQEDGLSWTQSWLRYHDEYDG